MRCPAQTTLTTLHTFTGGHEPYADLIQVTNGDLYGTASSGGAHGFGTVFRISTSGTQADTLYSFCAQPNCADGESPTSNLVQSTTGELYGTTLLGGANVAPRGLSGDGTVFKITQAGKLTTLYRFCAQPECTDGSLPQAGLIQATNGDLYGTTFNGGVNNAGTVFKITPSGTLTTLYSFCAQPNCTDGRLPDGGLVQASDGHLYGTTQNGGSNDKGTIFKITLTGQLTTVYRFCAETGCADGQSPRAALVQAINGDFYGTATAGGAVTGEGTVFRMTPAGKLTTLHEFCVESGCTDGSVPSGLVLATDGNLYGTTGGGGLCCNRGTVFGITPSGVFTTLYSFCAQTARDSSRRPMGISTGQRRKGNTLGARSSACQ